MTAVLIVSLTLNVALLCTLRFVFANWKTIDRKVRRNLARDITTTSGSSRATTSRNRAGEPHLVR